MAADATITELLRQQHELSTYFHVDLSRISRWRVGGLAEAIVEPRSITELTDVVGLLADRPEPVLVVGDMSNVLFDSRGFDGVIVRASRALAAVRRDGNVVVAEAGIGIPRLARTTADMGLSGLEHTVGIPGTLGGLTVMNGGSQRKGVGTVVRRVRCIGLDGSDYNLTQEDCAFAYRSSTLQSMSAVVVEVELNLDAANPIDVHAEMDAVVESRRSRFPEDLPNCGSTFLSDPAMYASVGPPGRAIEDAGLKGYTVGGAQVSTQHANFVVNRGGARSDDVLAVIAHVRETVHRRTGFDLKCEVRFVSRDGKLVPAHEAAGARDALA
ncbi:UDP-N-acetylmuramate dehydrogenase [Microbacterium sp. 2P01SA-2]|uniref:UDP-N-acetylmuramate dehydrogenase n=1 Tax=unclassified Microbacterium TaxID=2609290 RepID=UPI0039A09A37